MTERTRILKFSFPYESYVETFYRRRPGLRSASFDEQDQALKEDFFPGAADSLMHTLAPLGYQTFDIAASVDPLQRAWAQEHGVRDSTGQSRWDIARAQVLHLSPHVMFVDPYSVPAGWIEQIRLECPSLRLVVCRYSSPRSDLRRFGLADIVVSADDDQVREVRAHGIDAYRLHHAFDTRVLRQLQEPRGHSDILFVGQLIGRPGFHIRRMEVIEALYAADAPLEVRTPPAASGAVRQALSSIRFALGGPPIRRLGRRYRRRVQSPVFGVEMFQALRDAKVTLNVHGDVSRNYAANLRLWEATGVASCLLTDRKKNMSELFEEDREVVTFDSPEDCVEKALWLLDHRSERTAIGRAGQARTLASHTYQQRAAEVHEIVERRLRDR